MTQVREDSEPQSAWDELGDDVQQQIGVIVSALESRVPGFRAMLDAHAATLTDEGNAADTPAGQISSGPSSGLTPYAGQGPTPAAATQPDAPPGWRKAPDGTWEQTGSASPAVTQENAGAGSSPTADESAAPSDQPGGPDLPF